MIRPAKLDLDFSEQDKADLNSEFQDRVQFQLEELERTERTSNIGPSDFHHNSEHQGFFLDEE